MLLVRLAAVYVCVYVCVCVVVSGQRGGASDAEVSALHSLYTSTNGLTWLWRNDTSSLTRWNFTRHWSEDGDGDGDGDSNGGVYEYVHDPCADEWEGVECSKQPQQCIRQPCDITRLILPSRNLTGFLPSEIGELTALQLLHLEFNALTGTIPPDIGNMTSLLFLTLEHNSLSGSIPIEISKLIRLNALDLEVNFITGSLPTFIGRLPRLDLLDVENNLFTGSIPMELGLLDSLAVLNLQYNMFTGNLPESIGNISTLQIIDVQRNFMSGPIPHTLGKLRRVDKLDLDSNHFSGTIPPELGNLRQLVHLDVEGNLLTGTIPSELGALVNMEVLDLKHNSIVGSIPSALGSMPRITDMNLEDNMLSGTVPVELSKLHLLVYFQIQNNAITGKINQIFNSTAQLQLEIIDMSNNLLSGRYPEDMFDLPAVRVVSLSVNCFQDKLPIAMCRGRNLEVMSLNGLGSATGCQNTLTFPVSDVPLFNTIRGTVPDCVWDMSNLTVLHLTGNGLTGSLLSELPSHSSLADLSMSHNQLRGTIPSGFERVKSLDLSYNQFSGKYVNNPVHSPNSSVNFEINRLSGQLPVASLSLVSKLEILRGNMFSCDSIPENDEFVEDYICGSESLNESLYVFAGVVAILFCVLVMIVAGVLLMNVEMPRQLSHFTGTLSEAETCTYNFVTRKCEDLKVHFGDIIWIFIQMGGMMVITVLPIYALKISDIDEYSTHVNTYAWFWSLAYIRGLLPSILIAVAWIIMISFCFYYMIVVSSRSLPLESSVRETMENVSLAWMVLFCFGNGVVTIFVNVLYIYSTQQPFALSVHVAIQFSVAVFRLAYSFCVLPILARPITDTVININFRLRILIVNNLIIPCIVTALSSPACFQGLIIPANSVSTPYTYQECSVILVTVIRDVRRCVAYVPVEVFTEPVTPSFTYNNQCSSVLLTSYIPVLILGFSIQLTLCFVMPIVLTYAGSMFDLSSFVHRKVLKGIVWPQYWLAKEPMDDIHFRNLLGKDPTLLLNPKTLFCFDILNNFVVLLSFGLCSPVLALAIIFVVLAKMNIWKEFVTRFVIKISGDEVGSSDHYALVALARVEFPIRNVLKRSFWLIAMSTSAFFSLICWDIAADDVGWLQSLWIPLSIIFYPVLLRMASSFLYREGSGSIRQNHGSSVYDKSKDVELPGIISNPMLTGDKSIS